MVLVAVEAITIEVSVVSPPSIAYPPVGGFPAPAQVLRARLNRNAGTWQTWLTASGGRSSVERLSESHGVYLSALVTANQNFTLLQVNLRGAMAIWAL